MASIDEQRNRYERERYIALPRLLSDDVLDMVVAYAHILGATDRFGPDTAVGDSISRYGAPGFDALLVSLLDQVSTIADTTLVPTYSYVRVYFEGDELLRHRDRPACEHSVTLHLDSSGGDWPILFERADGTPTAIDLRPGDGIMYHGIELPHWRGPCPLEWYLQVFLHWVARDGSHGAEAFDRREGLGRNAVRSEQVIAR